MRLLMVMAVAVRENLRKRSSGKQAMLDNLRQVAEYLTVDEFEEYRKVVKNRPLLVMSWIGKYVHQAYIDRHIRDPTGQIVMSFDGNVSALLEGWMGMNKVCYQPVPFPYIHTLHWFLMLWLVTLPLVLVKSSGWWVVLILPLVAGALMAIEEVSEEIEDPFGDDLNDLPTENFEIGLIRDAGMVVNQHTGPMEFRCKAETGLKQVGQFVPIVDYSPAQGSAADHLPPSFFQDEEALLTEQDNPVSVQTSSLGHQPPQMDSIQIEMNPESKQATVDNLENKSDAAPSVPCESEPRRFIKRNRPPGDPESDGGVALAIEMMSPRNRSKKQPRDPKTPQSIDFDMTTTL
eukprot:TRINITY_DN12483_c0_g2_i3.p1 TRINITY_DN12483_c0_g2~~TRINITY_DN12483_c0_g2_i3.p1  ORF type:complete len:347 (-),score=64.81 TRINITY_DN12483_c0_g2_i3:270-1310(-)